LLADLNAIGEACRLDVDQCLAARRLCGLKTDNAQAPICPAHFNRDYPYADPNVEKACRRRAQPLSQPRNERHTLLCHRTRRYTAGGALRLQDLRVCVQPTGSKRAPLSTVDEVAALLVRRAQVGEQLPDRLVGQHRLQAINGFVGVAGSPCKPERDKNVEHSCRDFDWHSRRFRGFFNLPRRGEPGE
jgi:hypothetical protein